MGLGGNDRPVPIIDPLAPFWPSPFAPMVSLAGEAVTSVGDLVRCLTAEQVGQSLEAVLLRGIKRLHLTVQPVER